MTGGMDHRGTSGFSAFALGITLLFCGACGRTPLLDGWRGPPVDAQSSHGDSQRDSAPDGGVTIGNDAIAVASCSPNDATAVTIRIGVDRPGCASSSSGPYILVALWYTSWDNVKPGTYDLDANGGVGMSTYTPLQAVSNWELGSNTVLTVKSIDADRMTGHVDSSFPSGKVSVDFTAEWCDGHPLCG